MLQTRLERCRTSPSQETRIEAERRGKLDGKRWADLAHPAELGLLGEHYLISGKRQCKAVLRDQADRPGHERFVGLIRPELNGEELREASRVFWADQITYFKGLGRSRFHYLKAFFDAAICVWLAIRHCCESLAFARGVGAGSNWSGCIATPEEIDRLRQEDQDRYGIHRTNLYQVGIDDPFLIAAIILNADNLEDDGESVSDEDLLRMFWCRILGEPFAANRRILTHPMFAQGFVAGALGKADAISARF